MKWELMSSIKFVVQIIQNNKQYKVTYHKCKLSNEGMESKKIITENKHFHAFFFFFTSLFSSVLQHSVHDYAWFTITIINHHSLQLEISSDKMLIYRFYLLHLVLTIESKQMVVLDLDTKVSDWSLKKRDDGEKTVMKFNSGETKVYKILKQSLVWKSVTKM